MNDSIIGWDLFINFIFLFVINVKLFRYFRKQKRKEFVGDIPYSFHTPSYRYFNLHVYISFIIDLKNKSERIIKPYKILNLISIFIFIISLVLLAIN